MNIKILKLTEKEIQNQGIYSWPIWEKEASQFDWYYDSTEHCLILEGEVVVTSELEVVEIKKGDFVTFPKGLACKWDIKKDIKKHYSFES